MTLCFGCVEQIEGKPFKDAKGNTKYQDKPILDEQGQPNCINCTMYAIGMEYRRMWLEEKARIEKQEPKKENKE